MEVVTSEELLRRGFGMTSVVAPAAQPQERASSLMRGANHATRGLLLHLCPMVPLPPLASDLAHRCYRPTGMIASVCCTQTAHTSLLFFVTKKPADVFPTHLSSSDCRYFGRGLTPLPSSPTLNTPNDFSIRYHVPQWCFEISANATHRPVAASQGWELVCGR